MLVLVFSAPFTWSLLAPMTRAARTRPISPGLLDQAKSAWLKAALLRGAVSPVGLSDDISSVIGMSAFGAGFTQPPRSLHGTSSLPTRPSSRLRKSRQLGSVPPLLVVVAYSSGLTARLGCFLEPQPLTPPDPLDAAQDAAGPRPSRPASEGGENARSAWPSAAQAHHWEMRSS